MAGKKEEEDLDKEFDSGFSGETDVGSPSKEKKEETKVQAEVKKDDASEKKEEPPDETKKEDEKPEVITLTKQQFDLLMAGLEDNKSMKKALDTLSGTLGAQKQQMEQLMASSAGRGEVLDEDFAEMAKTYPEIADATKKGLMAFLKRTTGVAAPSSASKEDLKKLVMESATAQFWDDLEDEFEDAREIIGSLDKRTPYREWLAKQPEKYQRRLNSTYSPGVVARSIRKFQRDTEDSKAQDQSKAEEDRKRVEAEATRRAEAEARKEQLRSAAAPRGDGGGTQKPRQKTDDEEFEAGFKEESAR